MGTILSFQKYLVGTCPYRPYAILALGYATTTNSRLYIYTITANVSVAYSHIHEVLAAQSDAWRPAWVHLFWRCKIPLKHTRKHTWPSACWFISPLCSNVFSFSPFFSCPDPLIVIQRWRWRADGGDEQICSEENQRSFPQVKGVINKRGWRWLRQGSDRESVCERLCS